MIAHFLTQTLLVLYQLSVPSLTPVISPSFSSRPTKCTMKAADCGCPPGCSRSWEGPWPHLDPGEAALGLACKHLSGTFRPRRQLFWSCKSPTMNKHRAAPDANPGLREHALPLPQGRQGGRAMCWSQGFLGAFMKYLEFFKKLLRISLSCCLPTQMLSCNCVYCHSSVLSTVQECLRRQMAPLQQFLSFPNPPLRREKHPAEDTDPFFCYPVGQQVYSAFMNSVQRGRWVKGILSLLLIFPHWKSNTAEAKELTTTTPTHGVCYSSFQSPLSYSIYLHTVKLLHVTKVFLILFLALWLPTLYMTTNCNFACCISSFSLCKAFLCSV